MVVDSVDTGGGLDGNSDRLMLRLRLSHTPQIDDTDAVATKDARIIQFSGEHGTGLQHLAILVGRQAHAQVWPEIFSWLTLTGATAGR